MREKLVLPAYYCGPRLPSLSNAASSRSCYCRARRLTRPEDPVVVEGRSTSPAQARPVSVGTASSSATQRAVVRESGRDVFLRGTGRADGQPERHRRLSWPVQYPRALHQHQNLQHGRHAASSQQQRLLHCSRSRREINCTVRRACSRGAR